MRSYDSTEIDEILTLRVMTMTDEEKAQARATDPLAAQIIDRCDAMSPEAMQRLHGVLRDPHAGEPSLIPEIPDGVQWWDPLADNAVRPDIDAVLVNGVAVSRGSRVRLHPAAAPTRKTCSSRARPLVSPRCTKTSTATSTWGWSSKTTRRPTCTTGMAAICTSHPTKSNRSKRKTPALKGIPHGDRRVGAHRHPWTDRVLGRSDGPGVTARCPALPEDAAHVADSTSAVWRPAS